MAMYIGKFYIYILYRIETEPNLYLNYKSTLSKQYHTLLFCLLLNFKGQLDSDLLLNICFFRIRPDSVKVFTFESIFKQLFLIDICDWNIQTTLPIILFLLHWSEFYTSLLIKMSLVDTRRVRMVQTLCVISIQMCDIGYFIYSWHAN